MKKVKLSILLSVLTLFAMTALAGCGTKTETMKDREGNEFTPSKEIKTIVSTAPSNTEILMALGLGDKLVAIDNYSTDIEGINEELPKIDFRNPDAEYLIALNPDIIIASGHNREGDEDPFALLKEAGITVVYIPTSNSIDGIYKDIEFIGSVTGTENESEKLITSMKKEVNEIKEIGDKIKNKKKVYFEIGAGSGLYTFGQGTFMNELLEIVGAENIFSKEKSWITVTPEAVIDINPDVILSNSPGTNENGKTAVEDITSRDGWDTITAVANKQVFQVDKNTTSRASQNVVKALREIAKVIYPDEYKEK